MIQKIPLLKLLASNPILTTGLGLWGAAMLTFFTKDVPESAISFLTRQLTTSLEVTTRETEFSALINWIESRGFSKGFRSLRARNKALSAGFGRHYFFYRKKLCWFYRNRIQNKEYELEEITLTCLGRNQQLLRDLIQEASDSIERADKTRIYAPRWRSWDLLAAQSKRPLSSVVLSDENMKAVTAHLDWFHGAKDWYRKHGVPYRTGICLSGAPGTGKTSLVRAICAHYDLGLYTLDLVNSSDQELKEMVCQLGARSLFLLEDIDTVAAAWNRATAKEGEKTDKLTLGGVLNAIDGVAESDGRVLVITTNMREKLDPALLRPGRIDLQLELGPMSSQMFRAGFRNFFPDAVVPAGFAWPVGMTPAEFQQIVLRHSASPAALLGELRSLRPVGKDDGSRKPVHQDRVMEPVLGPTTPNSAQLVPSGSAREPLLWASGS